LTNPPYQGAAAASRHLTTEIEPIDIMAFGKLYSYAVCLLHPTSLDCTCFSYWQSLTQTFIQGNPRTTAIRAVAKANKLDLEIDETEPAKGVSQEYLKINPLGKVPSFVGADGYQLTECIAIAIYSTYCSVIVYLKLFILVLAAQ